MTGQWHEIEIEVKEAEYEQWLDTIVRIKIESDMTDDDIDFAIEKEAIKYADRNGLIFEQWDYL